MVISTPSALKLFGGYIVMTSLLGTPLVQAIMTFVLTNTDSVILISLWFQLKIARAKES